MTEEKKAKSFMHSLLKYIIITLIVLLVILFLLVFLKFMNLWWLLGIFGAFIAISVVLYLVLYLKSKTYKEIKVEEEKVLEEDEIINEIFQYARQKFIEPYPKGMEITHVSPGSPPTQLVYSVFSDYCDPQMLPVCIILDIKDKRKSIIQSRIGIYIKTREEFLEEIMLKINQMAKRPSLIPIRKIKRYNPETGTDVEVTEHIPAEKLEEEKKKEKEKKEREF